ncbi:IS91 family transposase [Geothrix sp. 21YS21S-2]|uniref:IS91 family transposase n=1 Tax=Geothrix sp. 21YS21S-2 TaxID=3068893 RepID=UPI0027BA3C43|nr:IS91 family transposase [Geothrix sp. 21YS21S-2]
MGPRPRFDIGEIVRRHRPALEARHRLAPGQKKVLTAISRCRTAALGGHKLVCEHGDYERIAYNSCRDRHCPKCQALAQEKWIAARSRRILAIGHFHVVFTLPAELRALARLHPAEVYQAMLRAVADTLLELGRTRKGLTFGLTLILHTWTRELAFHPHVHALVSTGGLSLDGGRFIRLKHRYLFPLKMLGDVFRGKVLAALGAARDGGKFPERTVAAYAQLIAQVKEKRWIAYVKKPFRKSGHVLHYLGRYTHRVGIANSRLVDVTDDQVTFRTKHGLTATLEPPEFLHRLVQHVLPPGFRKIRHAGLYAAAQPGGLLDQARQALGETKVKATPSPVTWLEQEMRACPVCGGMLHRVRLDPTAPRAPPEVDAPC